MLSPGDSFAGCTIVNFCGQGAYGTVYLAKDALGRKVALKIFHGASDNSKIQESLRLYAKLPQEKSILVHIEHFGVENGSFYYVMEAADNGAEPGMPYEPDSLDLRLKKHGRLPLDEALTIYHRLLDGIDALHRKNLVHRDIKPNNILFVKGQVKLGDPDLINDYTRSLSVVGTLGFIPPEQIFEKQPKTQACDIYALGKILYCCVTGETAEAYPHYPADLSKETLCRIVVPLSRICCTNPAMRAKNCEECRHLLPPDITEPPSTWQFLLTRLALSGRFRRMTLLSLLSALIIASMAGYYGGKAWRRFLRTQEANRLECMKEVKRLKEILPHLSLQVPPDTIGKAEELLRQAMSEAAHAPSQARGTLDEATAMLQDLAEKGLPPRGKSFEEISRMMGYLNSPLATHFLPRKKLNDLQRTSLIAANRLSPPESPKLGRAFEESKRTPLSFAFVPPGRYRSLDNGKIIHMERPFWMLNREISVEQFHNILGYVNSPNDSPGMPATHISLYDALQFCQALTGYLRQRYILPPGYGVRLPTESEWEYAAQGGWAGVVPEETAVTGIRSVYQSPAPNVLGLHDMEGNCMELTLSREPDAPSGVVFRGRHITQLKNSIRFRFPFPRDIMNISNLTFRPVIAYMGDFENSQEAAHPAGTITDIQHNGHHYAGTSVYYATLTRRELEELAHSLRARLPQPSSLAEWQSVRKGLKIIDSFPTYIGAEYSGNAWHPLDGTGDLPAIPTPSHPRFTALVGDETRFTPCNPALCWPSFILEWTSKENWEHRGDDIRSGKAPCVVKQFTVNEHCYTLIRLKLPNHLIEPFCKLIGASPATLPADPTCRQAIIRELEGTRQWVALGAQYRDGKWQWLHPRNSPAAMNLDEVRAERVNGSQSRYSPALDGLCLLEGKLKAFTCSRFILLEYPR